MRKNRNPYQASLGKPQYQPKVSKSGKEREDQRDGWNRGGKHKTKPRDIEIDEEAEQEQKTLTLQLGDEVKYEGDGKQDDKELMGKEGLVKNPDAHYGQIGIVFDGQYSLVSPNKLKMIEESLERLRVLSEMAHFTNTSGIRIPISEEEKELLEMVGDSSLCKAELDERQQEVARLMVHRGILKRVTSHGKKIKFKKNKVNIWRD